MQYMRGLRADPKAKQVTLRLMATTDLHVHVLAYDYYADKPSEHVGLERTAELIAQARHEVPDALLFDNGDFLQGNPMGDFIARNPDFATHPVHPVFAAMNQLGYQAATLGNHEFNYGLGFLAEALKGANFPIVSANIVSRQGVSANLDVTLVPPYILLDRVLADGNGHLHPLRIGVIGFAPPQIMQWDRGHLEGRLTARDIVDAATDWVPQMKAAGADVIVALAHSGIGPTDGVEDAENAASRLALVPGIDAIICGHSHMVFPAQDFPAFEGVDALRGTLFGKPAVMPGFYGSHLGVIDLLLDFGPEGWRVMDSTSEARPISGQISALQTELGQTELGQSVVNAHQRTLEYTRRAVGQNGRALHSYFAALGANTATRIVADAQAAYVRSALQGRPEADLPLLSGAAPFKAGGRGGPQNYTFMAAGDLAMRNIADLYIFPNTIAALRITGAQVLEWLENAVGIFSQLRADAPDQLLLDTDFPLYNFDMIFDLDIEIDLSAPARYDRHGQMRDASAQRIRRVLWQSQPLDPAAEFILATNSYRASGCGGFAGANPAQTINVGRKAIRDLLLDYVAAQDPLAAPEGVGWHFTPLSGVTAIFSTAPKAMAYLGEIATLRPVYMYDCLEGFACFRLTL